MTDIPTILVNSVKHLGQFGEDLVADPASPGKNSPLNWYQQIQIPSRDYLAGFDRRIDQLR